MAANLPNGAAGEGGGVEGLPILSPPPLAARLRRRGWWHPISLGSPDPMPGMGLWDIRLPPGCPTPLVPWLEMGGMTDTPRTPLPPAVGVDEGGRPMGGTPFPSPVSPPSREAAGQVKPPT